MVWTALLFFFQLRCTVRFGFYVSCSFFGGQIGVFLFVFCFYFTLSIDSLQNMAST